MHASRQLPVTLLAVFAATTVSLHAGEESGRRAFVTAWHDQAVILKQTLYSVAYDGADGVSTKRHVSGLTVATPATMYFRFDAPGESEHDLVGLDPDRLVSNLDVYEEAVLVTYERGMELIVSGVEIDRDLVRISLRRNGSDVLATTLTVQWPTALSHELSESALIEGVLARFFVRMP